MHGGSSPQSTANTGDPAPAVPVKKNLEEEVLDLEERAMKCGMSKQRIDEMHAMGKGHAQLLMRQSELLTYLDAS